MSSDEDTRVLNKKILKTPVEVQKVRLDRLMDNFQKPVFIPEKKDIRPPRAFQPHEYVRNVMGASAGAGSGEFDIYRGCRRRQLIREEFKNREAREKKANADWISKIENNKVKAESSTAKKRKKRMKRKGNQKSKKPTNGQNGAEKKEDASSSSTPESSDESETETATKEPEEPPPPAEVEVEEPTSTHEKTNVRKHLRHRQASSSDDEKAKAATNA